ncbi:hypothetical protein AB0D35_02495 [Streptomyces sp. NPDC048301]
MTGMAVGLHTFFTCLGLYHMTWVDGWGESVQLPSLYTISL